MEGGFYEASSPWFWAAILPPLIFAITVHEVAHGWVANQLGDPTALQAGRLTLNPIKHISLVGTIIVPVVLYLLIETPFGWAKPVPVDFKRLNSPRRDLILVAGAGPASNLLMALIWTLILVAGRLLLPIWGEVNILIDRMAQIGVAANVVLAVFNMLPIPPLDGGRVLHGLLPQSLSRILDYVEPFGILILIGLMVADMYTAFEFFLPFVLVPVFRVIEVYEELAQYLFTLAGLS